MRHKSTDSEEVCVAEIDYSWILPIIDYLKSGGHPDNPKEARKLRKEEVQY